MLEYPSFQSYPNDWLLDNDTIDWDMEQMGCYRQLVDYIWLNNGEILLDFPKLSAIFRKKTKKTCEKLWKKIENKFIIVEKDGGTYIQHKRINKERKRLEEQRLMKQKAGRKGGESKAKNASRAVAEVIPLPSSSSSSSSSISISSSRKKDKDILARPDPENSSPEPPKFHPETMGVVNDWLEAIGQDIINTPPHTISEIDKYVKAKGAEAVRKFLLDEKPVKPLLALYEFFDTKKGKEKPASVAEAWEREKKEKQENG